MKLAGLFNLFGSCATSFAAAVWAFEANLGLLAAFAIYAIGGAVMMLGVTALMCVNKRSSGHLAVRPKRAVTARLIEIKT